MIVITVRDLTIKYLFTADDTNILWIIVLFALIFGFIQAILQFC